jgi:hypothetical protein
VLAEEGLDLLEFEAEAAELDLMITAAEKVERAVRGVAGEVAGEVEARARGQGEGMRAEAVSGESGEVEVAAGEAGARDTEEAVSGEGKGLEMWIEEVDLSVADRPA